MFGSLVGSVVQKESGGGRSAGLEMCLRISQVEREKCDEERVKYTWTCYSLFNASRKNCNEKETKKSLVCRLVSQLIFNNLVPIHVP